MLCLICLIATYDVLKFKKNEFNAKEKGSLIATYDVLKYNIKRNVRG